MCTTTLGRKHTTFSMSYLACCVVGFFGGRFEYLFLRGNSKWKLDLQKGSFQRGQRVTSVQSKLFSVENMENLVKIDINFRR